MISKNFSIPVSCLLTAGFTLGLAATTRAQTTFNLDVNRSSLTVSSATFVETYNGSEIARGSIASPQSTNPPSNTTAYYGTLSVTLGGSAAAPTAITFNSATANASETGLYTPATTTGQGSGVGGSGTYAADYGLTGTTTGTAAVTVNAAIDAFVLSLSSGAIPVSGGSFSLGNVSLPANANYGYRSSSFSFGGTTSTIRGGGPFVSGNPAAPLDAAGTSGSYTVANGVATLTVPIDATYTLTSAGNLGGPGTATVVAELTGTLVATANVPEPATWAGVALGGLLLAGVLRARES